MLDAISFGGEGPALIADGLIGRENVARMRDDDLPRGSYMRV